MGNCCCRRKRQNVTHGASKENLQQDSQTSTNSDQEPSLHSIDKQTDHTSGLLSNKSIDVSIFSFESDATTQYKCVSEFCVDDPLDLKPCHVTGMTSLPDGSIVILDARNKKIKVFSPDFEYAFVQNARSGIRDVEYIGENEIAVTEGKSICFYKIENRYITKQVRKLTFDERLGCMSYNGHLMAVQCGLKGYMHIKILGTDGEEKYDVHLLSIITSVKRFHESIELDCREDLFYVTNIKSKCITCCEFHGSILWSTTYSLGFPRSLISLDRVLIFADWTKSKVYRLSPDGSKVSPVIGKGLRKPSFLAFQVVQNRLIVYANNRRLVQVFQISVVKQGSGSFTSKNGTVTSNVFETETMTRKLSDTIDSKTGISPRSSEFSQHDLTARSESSRWKI